MSSESRTNQPSSRQFYIRESFMGHVEEDMQHEFKGHRTICVEELIESYTDPATGRHTRRPISRNICGFLNTGKGGIVYLGVTDNGQIFGIPRTLYQKDHLRLSVQDTLSRFTPAVPTDLYEVRFVPVISTEDVERFDPDRYTQAPLDGPQRYEPHKLRFSRYCWCDSDAQARFVNGFLPDEYVVEIEVFPWDPTNPALESIAVSRDVPIHPLFTTETGNCYIRGQGGVVELTAREVAQLSMAQTRQFYQRKISHLQEQIDELQKRLQASRVYNL